MKNSLTNFLKLADAKHDINFHWPKQLSVYMTRCRFTLGLTWYWDQPSREVRMLILALGLIRSFYKLCPRAVHVAKEDRLKSTLDGPGRGCSTFCLAVRDLTNWANFAHMKRARRKRVSLFSLARVQLETYVLLPDVFAQKR